MEKIVVTSATVLFLSLSVFFASGARPAESDIFLYGDIEGHKGLSWSEKPTEEMVFIQRTNNIDYFRKPSDTYFEEFSTATAINSVTWVDILYAFYENQFYGVVKYFSGKESFFVLQTYYGLTGKIGSDKDLEMIGDKSGVWVFYDEDYERGFLSVFSATLDSIYHNDQKLEKNPVIIEDRELNAKVEFTGTQLKITNNDSFDWTNVEFKLNEGLIASGYRLKASRIESGQTYQVGLLQFTKPSGTRFNPFTTKPKEIWIESEEGFWLGGW